MKKVYPEVLPEGSFAMDKLWRRQDLLLLVSGSLPCIRGVYSRALKLNKLHQFDFVALSAEDYILGDVEEKIRRTIRQVALRKGVRIIVIYLSCLDILIRIDFADIERQMSKETGCIVKCFFRGPLGKTDYGNRLSSEDLLSMFPQEKTKIEKVVNIPPPLSDMAGISDCFQIKGQVNSLITPAGCKNCLRDLDMTIEQKNVYYTEIQEKDFIFGFEDTVENQVNDLHKKKLCDCVALINSSVPAFMGFDEQNIIKDRKNKFFPTDGFHDAVYGVYMSQLTVVKENNFFYEQKDKYVEILGYSLLLCGSKKQYESCISFIKQLGYEIHFLGSERESKNQPSLSWVVSSAGIGAARWLRDAFGVPLLLSLPIGRKAMESWKKTVKVLLKIDRDSKVPNVKKCSRRKEKVLLIGDPIQTMEISHYLCEKGFENVILAAYAWTKETKKIYCSICNIKKFHVFSTKEELLTLWKKADLVVGDPALKESMPFKPMISYPWGFFSGRNGLSQGDGVLGDNLKKQLQEIDIILNSEK